MPIYFYSAREQPYGCFSNFSAHGFELDGMYWRTSDHFFQAAKFAGTEHADLIRQAKSPTVAARMGRSRQRPLRADWETVKDDMMRRAVQRKFETHADIRAVLLGTGTKLIVESAPNDYYLGCGTDGSGQNNVRQSLM